MTQYVMEPDLHKSSFWFWDDFLLRNEHSPDCVWDELSMPMYNKYHIGRTLPAYV